MSGFNPERFKELRIIRKMTLAQLAENLGVTKQAVSKYELGKTIPSHETIGKILKLLNAPQQYLTKMSAAMDHSSSILFFRAASATTKTEVEFAEIESKWAYEVLVGLDLFEDIPSMNLPNMEESLSIPEKATHLRQFWNLGNAPIENMTAVLEANGIFVFMVNSSELHTDGYSRIINNIPIVVLNEYKGTAVRQRFSLAHELGHLILHRNLSETEFKLRAKEIESEASAFASSFLMQLDSFGNSIISPKLNYFLTLKREWKVSIAAMIYYCKASGIIDEQQANALQMQLSKQWGRKSEPFDDELAIEQPTFLFHQIHKHVTDKNSFEKFIGAVRLPIKDVEQLCCLPENYFSEYVVDTLNEVAPMEMEYEQLDLFRLEAPTRA